MELYRLISVTKKKYMQQVMESQVSTGTRTYRARSLHVTTELLRSDVLTNTRLLF